MTKQTPDASAPQEQIENEVSVTALYSLFTSGADDVTEDSYACLGAVLRPEVMEEPGAGSETNCVIANVVAMKPIRRGPIAQ